MRVPNPLPTPECIADVEWLEVAAGLLPEAKTRELMEHAAQCGQCGPLIRNAAQDLVDEATPNEEALLALLQSSHPEWRKNMGAKLRDTARGGHQRGSGWRVLLAWPILGYAWGGMIAAAIVAWVGVRAFHPPSAEQLLAQAYAEHRMIEVRIPGAKYAPLRVERSTGGSNLDKPAALLKAEAVIGENLQRHPDDGRWLGAKARADILDGNYESAIKALQRALETQPDSHSLRTDLGSAYFQRAETTDRAIDYGNAIEELSKVLAKSPDDPIALFNRALACEHMFLYTQAVEDWEHYLRVDPQGEWANEARSRLGTLKEKLKNQKKSQNEPLLTPEQIVEAAPGGVAVRTRIDERFEDYLNVAVRNWLLQAYPASNNALNDALLVRIALRELAEIGRQKHNDNWLTDLLATPDSQLVQLAFQNLATAIKDNDQADTTGAQLHASEAARIFSSTRNEAGVVRARLERLVAINIAQDGTRCMTAAINLKHEAVGRQYPWLIGQIDAETGSCLFLLEDIGAAHSEYLNAVREADSHRYRALGLRARDHICVLSGASGDLESGWRTASDGLASFWSGTYPNLRGYNLYYGLYELSREAKQPYLQMAAWRDGLTLVDTSPDIAQRAIAHSMMGTAAQTAGEMPVAERELSRAGQLFSEAPQIESTRIAAVEAEIRLAAVESAQGDSSRAIARLRPVEHEITRLRDDFLAILFYTTLGDAEFRQGDNQRADSSLRSAVNLAEVQLRSLRDDKARIDWDQQAAGAYRSLVQLTMRRGDAQDALALWEWYRGAVLRSGSSSSNSTKSPILPVRALQAQIPSLTNETVVTYAILPDGLATWVYDDRGIASRWTELLPDELEAKVTSLRRLCSRPDSDKAALNQESRALYESLISPIEQKLDTDRVLVVELDPRLASLPFDALKDGHDQYLSDRFPIVYSLGIYYRPLARRSTAISSRNSALVVAVPSSTAVTDAPVQELSDVITEADLIAHSFHTATVLAGREASARNIHSSLSDKSVLHFAGHAFSSTRQTGLLLADGLLTAPALKTVELADLDLAVFSACDTQDGSTGAVNDSDSLVRTFLRAGVPHVVASRWNVESGATLQFMSSFYRTVLTGNTVPRAIHQAQLELRSKPDTASPYYWSAFASFGVN